MIRITAKGNFGHTHKFLKRMQNKSYFTILDKYGKKGVDLLQSATPIDSGETAQSWGYEITEKNGNYTLRWFNMNVNDGVNIAVILQYGHATKSGGWVEGRDYINPAMKPIFENLADEVWREVKNA